MIKLWKYIYQAYKEYISQKKWLAIELDNYIWLIDSFYEEKNDKYERIAIDFIWNMQLINLISFLRHKWLFLYSNTLFNTI